MFSSRLTLQGDGFSRRMAVHERKTRQQNLLARGAKRFSRLVVEHFETAAGNERRDVPTAEAGVGVGVKQRVGEVAGFVARGENRVGRKIFCHNRVVRRNRERGDFKNTKSGAAQRTVETMNETVVAVAGSFDHAALLDALAHFAPADEFIGVAHAAAKFLVGTGAAGSHQRGEHGSERKNNFTHTISDWWFEFTPIHRLVKRVFGRAVPNTRRSRR